MRVQRNIRAILLYFGAPALSALAPLAVIPAITARLGADGWASAALALAVGNAGLVIAEVGWGVLGPQLVSKSPRSRRGIYRRAFASKLLAVGVVAPSAAIVTAALVKGNTGGAALLAGAGVLAALSPAWFFVGTHRPAQTLVYDTIPRVVLSLAAAGAILLGAGLVVYGGALALASVASWLLAARFGGLPLVPRRHDIVSAPATIRAHLSVVAGRTVSTVYTSLPSAFLGAVAPTAVAAYTALDRPLRMGFGILGAVPARLQSYVGVRERAVSRRRSRVAIAVNVGVGVAAASVFIGAMPIVAPLLFSGVIEIDSLLLGLGALLIVVMSTSRGLALALVAADAASQISVAVTAAAATAIVALPVLGSVAGAAGGVAAVIAAETVGVAVQAVLLRRAWSDPNPSAFS